MIETTTPYYYICDDYWIFEDTIYFKPDFNSSIDNFIFNNKIRKIEFSASYDKEDYIEEKHENVRDCSYRYNNFNKPLNINSPIITHIYLHHTNIFNHDIDNLPCNLQYLHCNNNFNKNVDNLPLRLLELILRNHFNKNVDNLPESLLNLVLGFMFNKNIDNLPQGLLKLVLGYKFNQSINFLPNNLTLLVLGYEFNQPINSLPKNLLSLHICSQSKFNKILNKLPKSIEYISINKKYLIKHKFTILNRNFEIPMIYKRDNNNINKNNFISLTANTLDKFGWKEMP